MASAGRRRWTTSRAPNPATASATPRGPAATTASREALARCWATMPVRVELSSVVKTGTCGPLSGTVPESASSCCWATKPVSWLRSCCTWSVLPVMAPGTTGYQSRICTDAG